MTDDTSTHGTPQKMPAPEYDSWSVDEIALWAANATDEQRQVAIAYESSHQNRADVLEALGATPEE